MPPSLLKYLLNTCIPIILLILTTSDVNGEQAKRDQIGTVLGKPVYRDQIAAEKGLTAELFRIFSIEENANQYREKHLAEITPTEDEIEAARAFFDGKHAERIKDKEAGLRSRLSEIISQRQAGTTAKEDEKRLKLEQMNIESQLAVPGRSFATYMLSHWKFQKHLYDNYGGGRLLWQQAGIEAYDANDRDPRRAPCRRGAVAWFLDDLVRAHHQQRDAHDPFPVAGNAPRLCCHTHSTRQMDTPTRRR
jgi:hypothetical protein